VKAKQPDGTVIILSCIGLPIRVRTNKPFRPNWYTVNFVGSPFGILEIRMKLKGGRVGVYQYGVIAPGAPPIAAVIPSDWGVIQALAIQRVPFVSLGPWTGGYAFNYFTRRMWFFNRLIGP